MAHLSSGIIGLPNVGKSTLFNALMKAGAAVAAYPFCTIEANVGIVPVSDSRVDRVGGKKAAHEQGLMRIEGRDYVVHDGDVIYFRIGP